VDSRELNKRQRQQLARRIADMHGWIQRLKTRMEHTGFPLDDPMYRAVCDAEHPLHTLRVRTHYFSCGDGTVGDGRF
jgi:hypothetical protein